MIQTSVLVFLLALCVSFGVALLTRYVALRFRVLNVPIFRSLHSLPMPSMGGVGILIGFWTAMGVLYRVAPLMAAWREALPALLAGTGVVFVILLDDIRPMSVLPKLSVLLAATGVSVALGLRMEEIHIPGLGLRSLGGLAIPLSAFWFLWMMNIYNFMDGIDGIAAGEAVVVATFLFAFSAMRGRSSLSLPALALAGAAAGFLLLNLPPSRMFMGDIGSNFLGFMFAGLAIIGSHEGIPFLVMLWLLGAFVFDSTYTLLRRVRRGENILRAHRSHLYQRLVLLGWTHGRVDLALLGVNLLLGLGAFLYLRGNAWPAFLVLALVLAVLIYGTVRIERADRRRVGA